MFRAKKSLGQNFLSSKRIVERIVMESRVSNSDTVLEIGPGKGILTEALLAKAKKVLAVEKDDNLFEFLKEKFSAEIKNGKLELIHSDVLDLNFSTLHSPLSTVQYKLVANIPYNITGEIIRKFLEEKNQPKSMTLLVQKEVADRILTKDGKESILSLSVKVFGTPRAGFKISKGQFTPAPKVDSFVISIDDIKNPFKDSVKQNRFFEIVKKGFAHKRKIISSNLKEIISKEKLSELGIDEKERAENIPLEKWLRMIEEKN